MYILLTAVLCLALCFGVIYPLWLFATTDPHLYTVIILSVTVLSLAFLFIRRLVRQYKAIETAEGRKRLVKRFLLRFASFIAVASAILFFIFFVLNEQRVTAFIILAFGVFISVVLGRIRKHIPDV